MLCSISKERASSCLPGNKDALGRCLASDIIQELPFELDFCWPYFIINIANKGVAQETISAYCASDSRWQAVTLCPHYRWESPKMFSTSQENNEILQLWHVSLPEEQLVSQLVHFFYHPENTHFYKSICFFIHSQERRCFIYIYIFLQNTFLIAMNHDI